MKKVLVASYFLRNSLPEVVDIRQLLHQVTAKNVGNPFRDSVL